MRNSIRGVQVEVISSHRVLRVVRMTFEKHPTEMYSRPGAVPFLIRLILRNCPSELKKLGLEPRKLGRVDGVRQAMPVRAIGQESTEPWIWGL
jgi:hypothetical protein